MRKRTASIGFLSTLLGALPFFVMLWSGTAWAQKYTGPHPPKPDVLYLVHADTLISTEVLESPGGELTGANAYGRADFRHRIG